MLGVSTLVRELGRQKLFVKKTEFDATHHRQHSDHANEWVRFLHRQGREVFLEQLVILFWNFWITRTFLEQLVRLAILFGTIEFVG